MDFISLIDDCKEIIFRRLDLSDLVNLSDACKQFHPIACRVFNAKFGGRKVTIDRLESTTGRNSILTSPTITLRLLRNFGHLISELQINFALFDINLCERIEEYLVKYSIESLRIVSFRCNPHKELYRNIKEPFSHIYSIEMQSCCFLRSKLAYNKFFPRLRYLQVDANRYEIRSINTDMPFVTSLGILEDSKEEEIENALKRNPRIVKLLLATNYSSQLIRNLNDYLPKLQCLCMRGLPKEFNEKNFETVDFDHLLDLSVSFGPETLEKLPFKVSSLRHLSIAGRLFLDRYWFRLLHRLSNLQSIGLFDIRGDASKLLNRISGTIQNLNIITISTLNIVPAECIINYIKFVSNRSFLILTSNQTDFDKFVRNIQSQSPFRLLTFPEAQQFKVRVQN